MMRALVVASMLVATCVFSPSASGADKVELTCYSSPACDNPAYQTIGSARIEKTKPRALRFEIAITNGDPFGWRYQAHFCVYVRVDVVSCLNLGYVETDQQGHGILTATVSFDPVGWPQRTYTGFLQLVSLSSAPCCHRATYLSEPFEFKLSRVR